MKLDILAVGAHPDDIELACAGTLIKAAASGYKTGIVDLTEGELGTRGNNVIRRKEAAAAAKILGCLRENLHMPDGNIELTRANILKLVQCYRKYRPEILLIPHFHERHLENTVRKFSSSLTFMSAIRIMCTLITLRARHGFTRA
jgi:LmbE family N-acetylglucosaminyl deacetylase